MLKIYGSAQSSAARCFWLMEELNLPYEAVSLSLKDGDNKKPEYLALNPNGKIPTLIDGEYVIWESGAINVYLAAKYQPDLLGTTPEERGMVAQWSVWSQAEFYPAFKPLVNQAWRKTPDNEATLAAPAEIAKVMTILNNHLEGKEFVALNRFTLADMDLAVTAALCGWLQIDMAAYPNVERWLKAMQARPAQVKLNGAVGV